MIMIMWMIMTCGSLVQTEIQRFVNQKKVDLSFLRCLLHYHYHDEDGNRGGNAYDDDHHHHHVIMTRNYIFMIIRLLNTEETKI